MKHKLRPAIHMEKSLLTDWVGPKLGGTESQGVSRAGQTVLARLMESQIWHPPASSVTLLGEGSEKGQWPLPAFLSGRNLSFSSHLDARHFSFSQYATGTFQAATPVMELRGSECELVLCGFFKRNA